MKDPAQRLAKIRSLAALRLEKQKEDSALTYKINSKNGNKTREKVGYNIHKLLGINNDLMKSEDERKEKLDIAVQRKKDRMTDDLFTKKKKKSVEYQTAIVQDQKLFFNIVFSGKIGT